ncbi:uncharacterized protein [Haliotis asinina]|uniref:uncharacterized protein n=1 Tax=Haliotis asinina TaxID=109174 RepID=UPI00353223FB
MAMGASSSAIVVTAVVAALAMGAGLIIGYLLRPQVSSRQSFDFNTVRNRTLGRLLQTCGDAARDEPEIQRYLLSHEIEACKAYTCSVPLPRTYQVYHLLGAKIEVDGRLDEKAWQEVAWSQTFIDIKGSDYPAPRFQTNVKVRWDDENLYIAAYLEETDVWANRSLHDTTVYQDNAFQVMLDTEQSNHKYKEITMNALGTVSDIMLTRPYMDDGEPLSFWESDVIRGVHTDGPINDPSVKNKFWTLEMSIPFKTLFAGIKRNSDVPSDRETWRANFVRSEWMTEVVGGKYHKRLDMEADWWVWSSPGVSNIHLPDKWGLLQFRKLPVNSTQFVTSTDWVTRNALLDLYRAEKAYRATTGRYTDKLELLKLPPYVLSKRCVRDMEVKLDWGGFRATAFPVDEKMKEGHTRTDRYVWFGENNEELY